MADERSKVVGSLGGGLQVEMEKVDFEPRLDTKEDRLNDGEKSLYVLVQCVSCLLAKGANNRRLT